MATTGAILSLAGDGEALGRTTRKFEEFIVASFISHPMRCITRNEVKRRFEMCVKIFEHLRAGAKWSLPRIFDQLPAYLGCELDGVDWKPDTRTIWTPPKDDGSNTEI